MPSLWPANGPHAAGKMSPSSLRMRLAIFMTLQRRNSSKPITLVPASWRGPWATDARRFAINAMTITLFSRAFSSPRLIAGPHYRAEVVQERDRLEARLVFSLTSAIPYRGVFALGDLAKAKRAVLAAAKRRELA